MSATSVRAISIRVSDVMSSQIVSVSEKDTVSTVVTLLLKSGVGSVLVVNEIDLPVGIITKGDVLGEAFVKHLDPDVI